MPPLSPAAVLYRVWFTGLMGRRLAWFGYDVQECHLSKLLSGRDRERETVIFELEALALAICLSVFGTFVERRGAVVFTDNDGVLGSFIRGHNANDVCAILIEYFGQCEEELENVCWLDRVPSASNPADGPSKLLGSSFIFWWGVARSSRRGRRPSSTCGRSSKHCCSRR